MSVVRSGVVLTDQNGITKKSLWKSQVFRWEEIPQVQVHKRDAGAIELRAGSRRLIVDSRFVAPHPYSGKLKIAPMRPWRGIEQLGSTY